MWCPECSMQLKIRVLGQDYTIDNSLQTTCEEKQFNINVSAKVQPGQYATEVHRSFVNESTVRRKHLGYITVNESIVEECSFENSLGLCQKWNTGDEKHKTEGKWTFSSQNNLSDHKGYFAYTGGTPYVTKLETPWISAGESVRLCLTFRYSMRAQASSSLNVSLKSIHDESEVLLYNLIGYHGDTWSVGQVSWMEKADSKIVFRGFTNSIDEFAIGIDEVKISTSNCEVYPVFSSPGFQCSSDEFVCDNGECVSSSLRCDGDMACLDNSDEQNCACLSNEFKCDRGACVHVTKLCDGVKDCPEGSDETNCAKPCSEFQCADGTCVPWSSTCRKDENSCPDHTHFPPVCGSRDCPLNNLACKNERDDKPQCKSFRGYCDFENGLCGLTSDNSTEFQWSARSGKTPSENSGPAFDHTTYTDKGVYIFVEASQRSPGDRARLVSDWLAPNEPACLQFWYHMYGRHIGELNIILETSQSERRVWHQGRKDHGDKWNFAQTTIQDDTPYKFVIEAQVGNGLEGDIALDDLAVLDENCTSISSRVTPDCDFSTNMCSWSGDPDWRIHKDKYLYLHGGKEQSRQFISPPIHAAEAKCIRFWFKSEGKYFTRSLQLVIKSSDSISLSPIWSVDEETPKWTFMQIPLQYIANEFQVVFEGLKQQSQPTIEIDDISFSKEICNKTAPSVKCYNYLILNTADRLVNYSTTANTCDDTLDFNRWYRITGAAGTQIPEQKVPYRRCGARYPGWMDGVHPSVEDGVVTRDVCFVLGYSPCRWRLKIKVQNCGEFFVYKLTAPSYCSQRYCGYHGKGEKNHEQHEEWWGWKNENQRYIWKLTSANELQQLNDDINYIEKNNTITKALQENFDVHLRGADMISTEVKNVASFTAMTFCLWVASKCSLLVDYNVTLDEGQFHGFGLVSHTTVELIFMETETRSTDMSINDGQWHHMCFTWTSSTGQWQAYKDGTATSGKTGSKPVTINAIPGNGTLSIRFKEECQNLEIFGKISTFNLWSYAMGRDEIIHMSYGCGKEAGNVLSWLVEREKLKKLFATQNSSTCNERNGPSLVVGGNVAGTSAAVYVGPVLSKSKESYGKCLKFKYKIVGPGARSLTIYQEMPYGFEKQPIWTHEAACVPSYMWHYGQTHISTISSFRLSIEGELDGRPGYLAVGGVFMSQEYCSPQPVNAQKACSQSLNSSSGFIVSPFYPGYYTNNMTCTWHLTAKENHVIRLHFQSFAIENHPTCANDYVEVRDGGSHRSRTLGKYCGHTVPPFIESSSNVLTIVFSTNDVNTRTGFKAYYHTKPEKRTSCIEGCPRGCTCSRLPGSDIRVQIESDSLMSLPGYFPETVAVMLFGNNKISRIRIKDFANLQLMEYLDLSNNVILDVEKSAFKKLTALKTLRLNGNFLEQVTRENFQGLSHLDTLDLGANLLREVRDGVFQYLKDLKVLSLRSNKLQSIEVDAFRGLANLTFLYLHNNSLTSIQRYSFRGLNSLETLFLHGNPLSESDVAPDAFSELTSLKILTLDQFILCCYAVNTIPNLKCQSPAVAFSTCDDLMKNNTLRMCIWILGLLAFIGNFLVIIWRVRMRDENKVQSFMLTNLACSDFLMGVYLLIIAIKDLQWKGEYFQHDVAWRTGHLCRFAGALSMLSSEVSVLMLLAITMDRLICVVFALRMRPLSLRSARIICSCIWIFGIIISFIPWTGISYFQDKKRGIGFFGSSAVCLPLQFSEGKPAGWEYSTAFFITLNGVAFLCILTAYVLMFWTTLRLIRSSQARHMIKAESTRATRLFFIVLTDFFCWMPVIILGILSLTGDFRDPKHEAKVWIAVFVLPVNSAINPILYTFSTLGVRRKLRAAFKRRFGAKLGSGISHQRYVTGGSTMLDTEMHSEHRQTESQKNPPRKLHILEKADGFHHDADVFFLIAKEEIERLNYKLLLKCFLPIKKNAFDNERKVLESLPHDANRSDIPFLQWYTEEYSFEICSTEVDIPQPSEDMSILCFKLVSGISLLTFMEKNSSSMSLALAFHLALDVINALEYLHDHGVNHNGITPANILLIERHAGIPRWRAMLMNFDQASVETSHLTDIKSFGDLLKGMVQQCNDNTAQMQAVLDTCLLCNRKEKVTAAMVRLQLEESWSLYFMETKL
ncbi:uncharacterized protein LOC144658924 [Oculina patagonica]